MTPTQTRVVAHVYETINRSGVRTSRRPYGGDMSDSVAWARELASACMAEELPRRWGHVQAVAAKAESLRLAAEGEGEGEADLLVMAAWLHDIGYAPGLVDTGFHPLDG